jgi:inosine-uridine nucleoside N-ribohydrolase
LKRILFDCDPGVDDALALILALNSHRVRIEGITTVAGNSPVSQTTLNACRLLDYLDADVPVAKGAGRPLRASSVRAERVHGKDGLGDSDLLPPRSGRRVEEQGAVEFMIARVAAGVKTLVATGPLTNVALAFRRDASVMSGLRELIIMGGAVRVPGNVDSVSEFNFYSDPDAADYVLKRTSVEKVLVPLDVTHRVMLTPADLEGIGASRSGSLVRSMVLAYQRGYGGSGFPGAPLHDPLAMGYCLDRTFLQLTPMFLRVEPAGAYTRGACVPEERRGEHPTPDVRVALGVDSRRFLDFFKATVSR